MNIHDNARLTPKGRGAHRVLGDEERTRRPVEEHEIEVAVSLQHLDGVAGAVHPAHTAPAMPACERTLRIEIDDDASVVLPVAPFVGVTFGTVWLEPLLRPDGREEGSPAHLLNTRHASADLTDADRDTNSKPQRGSVNGCIKPTQTRGNISREMAHCHCKRPDPMVMWVSVPTCKPRITGGHLRWGTT